MATPKEKKSITISLPSHLNLTHILVGLLIVASFGLGALSMRVMQLEKGSKMLGATTGTDQLTPSANAAVPTEDSTPKQVPLDDDPILGQKDAPVTMVEFSDYECPFCKRHFDQTYPQLLKNYVETGKLKIVFRDMPLSFHDPMSTKESMAADCAREQGGDETYFKYHDAIFKETTSNGNGLDDDKIYKISQDLGLDADAIKSCMDSGKYKDEIAHDIADATKVGANATPSFFIGKSTNNGVITGTPLIGAYPYDNFKALIDKYL